MLRARRFLLCLAVSIEEWGWSTEVALVFRPLEESREVGHQGDKGGDDLHSRADMV